MRFLKRTIAVAFCRWELPGWGAVLRRLDIDGATLCAGGDRTRTIRGKMHGQLMRLDLDNAWDRRTYLLGRFVELETELFARAALRPGDCVIDVGANRGMFTLTAAALVGARGRVHAFEPNPSEARRVEELIRLNGLEQVLVHQEALGDAPCQMTLNILDNLSALATLAPPESMVDQRVTATATVAVRRADDALRDAPAPALVKVDVEGFEYAALSGMTDLLREHSPALLVELEESWLRRAGSSCERVIGLLRESGYCGAALWVAGLWPRQRARLDAIESEADLERARSGLGPAARNTVWWRPGSPMAERIEPLLTGGRA